MTAPRRREHQPDPYRRGAAQLAHRHPDRCDCPCHWWPAVTENGRCCDSAGMRYVPAEDAYTPWPEGSQP